MKANVHPQWHDDTVVTCACGHTFVTGSTQPTIHVDICSHCHPLFTGELKYADTLGRVERFERLRQAAQTTQSRKQAKQTQVDQLEDRPQTLKEMLQREQKKTHVS